MADPLDTLAADVSAALFRARLAYRQAGLVTPGHAWKEADEAFDQLLANLRFDLRDSRPFDAIPLTHAGVEAERLHAAAE